MWKYCEINLLLTYLLSRLFFVVFSNVTRYSTRMAPQVYNNSCLIFNFLGFCWLLLAQNGFCFKDIYLLAGIN